MQAYAPRAVLPGVAVLQRASKGSLIVPVGATAVSDAELVSAEVGPQALDIVLQLLVAAGAVADPGGTGGGSG